MKIVFSVAKKEKKASHVATYTGLSATTRVLTQSESCSSASDNDDAECPVLIHRKESTDEEDEVTTNDGSGTTSGVLATTSLLAKSKSCSSFTENDEFPGLVFRCFLESTDEEDEDGEMGAPLSPIESNNSNQVD